jgi:quercetin dioxygenase-like cupin family protein
MRRAESFGTRAVVVGLGCLLAVAGARAQDASTEVKVTPAELKWGPAPPVFEKGASMAVVSGDPGKAAPFVVRLKLPAGYKINPHFHPTDENVTVISGTFAVAMGDKFEAAGMKTMPAGSFALLPAQMHHYAMAKTPAVVQVHALGPFALTYVNPADDPSKRMAPARAQ